MDKLETNLDDQSAKSTKSLDQPLLNLPSHRSKRTSLVTTDQSTVKAIEQLFTKLTPNDTSTSKDKGLTVLNQQPITNTVSDHSETDTTDNELNQLAHQFQPTTLNKIHYPKVNPHNTKNWYSKPTPVDLQFEDTNISNQFSVSAKKLYEWNIDGLSEDQILQKLNHLSMVANSYLSNYPQYSQPEIVSLLTSGFTGILYFWILNYFSRQKPSLLATKKTFVAKTHTFGD